MKKLVVLLLFSMGAFAIEPVVNAEWLNKNLTDKNLRVVHVSEPDDYLLEHIPSAQNSSIGKWRESKESYLLVRSSQEIQDEIQRLGIDEKSRVVLYANISSPMDLLKSTYIYWALNYHGIKDVAILNGGMNSWMESGYELSDKVAGVKKSDYKVKIDSKLVADKAYVMQNLNKLPMIDARPADKYLGITPTDTVERDGHISGAMSYSWNYSIDNSYMLKDIKKLEALFRDGYKLDKESEVLVYCTGGLETSFNYFVLSGVLGYKHVRLYDASMKEWGNYGDTPMTKYRYEMFKR
ncbi:sulfurtransferase [Sulfurimonas crateris]|uniref:Sulfurtransferase n=1 Tax=Sulfurimonas crateris TaxID=2574727 RepID=A0A4U2Z896_9BACT|nr:rhodanese-like domain-containing protein [Sulfurimonas crateris]TKI70294.1 sulfurtransferase [Sulfurimonas crateris]